MDIFKNISWFIKKNKWQYVLGILALVLSYIFVPIPTFLIGKIVDGVRNATLDTSLLSRYGVILILAIIILYLLEFTWHYFIFGNSFKFGRDNRRRILEKLLAQNPQFYYKNSTGSLMSKATHDVGNMQMLLGYGILALFDASLYPISLVLVMGLTISWKLTLISITVLPIMIFLSARLGRLLDEKFATIQRSMERLNESVLENVTSIRVIKGFSTQDIVEKRFQKSARKLYDDQMSQTRLSSLFIPMGRIIPAISYVIAFFISERMLATGQISLGQMVSFFMYLNMLIWPMFAFGDLINVWKESSSSVRRVQGLYDYEEDFVEENDLAQYEGGKDIEFKNFSFSYPGSSKKALDSINLTIKAGETLGIVGKIGAGKTTLVKQLLRQYNVDRGSLLLGGRDAEDFTRKSIRDKIGYVPQQHTLFSKTVSENIAFGKSTVTGEEIARAVEFADFTKDLASLPDSLDTLVGEKGVSLSGGQKQRISISRAIIKDPEILILDDSLSAVDALTEKNIIDHIKNERQGKTTIIVAHRLSGLKHADKIIVLEDGKIIEEGSHDDLIAKRGWYYSQYESQKLGGSDE